MKGLNMVETPTLLLSDIVVKNRFRQDMGDLQALADSIKRLGLLCPVTVRRADKVLVDGGRRMEAFKILGYVDVPVHYNDCETLAGQLESNEQRKPFTITERLALADEIAKRLAGGLQGNTGADRTDVIMERIKKAKEEIQVQGDPVIKKGEGFKVRDIVAHMAGFGSEMDMRRARYVKDHADDKIMEEVNSGARSVASAEREIKAAESGKPNIGKKPAQARQRKQTTGPSKVHYDREGAPLPAKFQDIFADSRYIDAIEYLKELRKDVKSANWNRWMEMDAVTSDIDSLISSLQKSLPHAVHTACDAKGCKECRNVGWVPEWRYDDLVNGEVDHFFNESTDDAGEHVSDDEMDAGAVLRIQNQQVMDEITEK